MNITPDNAPEFQHKEWLAHPMTQQLIKRVNEFRETCVRATYISTRGDAADRIIFANIGCIANLDAVKELINNTDKFLNKQTNQEPQQ